MGWLDFLTGKSEPIQTEEETRQVMEEAEREQINADNWYNWHYGRELGEIDDD